MKTTHPAPSLPIPCHLTPCHPSPSLPIPCHPTQDGLGEAFLASCQYVDVAKSISPLVRAFIGLPHDVYVRRPAADAPPLGGLATSTALPSDGTVCIKLRLVPERWSGQGLLGCILR